MSVVVPFCRTRDPQRRAGRVHDFPEPPGVKTPKLPRALRPLGALAGLTVTAALLNRRLRRAAPPPDTVGGTPLPWTWRGYRIHATELGTGPTVVLVHGIYAGASSFEYRSLAPLLARTHRVVVFDFLGCGRSEMPNLDYSAELFIEQIVDALGEFCDGPMTLVGSAIGAAFAIVAAGRAPDRVSRLVTISPTGLGVLDGEGGGRGIRATIGRLLRTPVLGESLFNLLTSPRSIRYFLKTQSYADERSITPEVVGHFAAVTHQHGARFVPAAFVGGALDCGVAQELPFVAAPLLVIWGEDASKTSPVRLAANFERLARDGTIERVPHAGLLPQEEAPERTAAAIVRFAAGGEGSRAPGRSAPDMATKTVPDIFKSYDVRGLCPSEFDADLAHGIGRAFVLETGAKSVVVGRDMRASGTELFEAFARGATELGCDVTDIGLVSTDALYFAVGAYGFDGGVMITASHNPATYNGMKFTREAAQAISLETGLRAMKSRIERGDLGEPVSTPGNIGRRDVLDAFAAHCLTFVDAARIRPFKIAIDAGNGMAGLTVPHVFSHLPCEVTPLYFELDGTFPNHPASPLEPENMVDLQKAVLAGGCDLGVAFDGDADRMFIVDEQGGLVGGDMVTALVAINTLKRYPGAKVLYNLICSRSVPEEIERHGGVPVRSQVGHSLIKKTMREEDVVFGGEHSGHFYFRDNWFADSGMIALLQCLEVFSDAAVPVSEIIAPIDGRFRSGEINTRVRDTSHKLAELVAHYPDATIDRLDGVTIQYPEWWMNVRPSNTEPLLRLNVEGDSHEIMTRRRDEALALIRSTT